MEPIDFNTRSYIRRVTALPGLERAEEQRLAAEYQAGNKLSGQRLIIGNLRHVIPVALRYRRYGVPVGELIAEGNLALLSALPRFEPERGLRFATYATYWIRADVLALVLRQRSLVGGGRGHLRPTFFFRLRREYARLLTLLGDAELSQERLAASWKRSPAELQEILERLEHSDTSLETPSQSGTSQRSWLETKPAPGRSQEEQLALARGRACLERLVHGAASALDARERFILEHRLMAEPEAEYSLVHIGKRFGVSRERARQLEQRVKDKLRTKLSAVLSEPELLEHLSVA